VRLSGKAVQALRQLLRRADLAIGPVDAIYADFVQYSED
jgi:hypothetical protein